MSEPPGIVPLLDACSFKGGIPLVAQTLREASTESPEWLTEAARGIVAWLGIFGNTDEARSPVEYFRAVDRLLQKLAGAGQSVVL